MDCVCCLLCQTHLFWPCISWLHKLIRLSRKSKWAYIYDLDDNIVNNLILQLLNLCSALFYLMNILFPPSLFLSLSLSHALTLTCTHSLTLILSISLHISHRSIFAHGGGGESCSFCCCAPRITSAWFIDFSKRNSSSSSFAPRIMTPTWMSAPWLSGMRWAYLMHLAWINLSACEAWLNIRFPLSAFQPLSKILEHCSPWDIEARSEREAHLAWTQFKETPATRRAEFLWRLKKVAL